MVLDLGGSSPGPTGPEDDSGQARSDGAPLGGRRRTAARRPATTLLYEQVVQLVDQIIADRQLAPGDLLPSYTDLADQAGVSLITVRRALDELERAGRVRRHQGLGTFVARPRIVTEPGRAGSLLGTLAKDGEPAAELGTRVLELKKGQPSADLGKALRIETTSPVWRLRRLRLLDGQPAVLETSVIPVALAPELDALVGRLGGSLYDLLASEYGLTDSYEEQYLEVIGPAQEEARLLKLPARSQVVRIRGLSMDDTGLPFDCFEQLYPAHQFAFAISGSATRQLLPSPGHRDWGVSS
ncbi:MAG TPA: GntR family transcriptional regulator [Streptosporangiaceae bacterium]